MLPAYGLSFACLQRKSTTQCYELKMPWDYSEGTKKTHLAQSSGSKAYFDWSRQFLTAGRRRLPGSRQ